MRSTRALTIASSAVSLPLWLVVALVWGLSVNADSAQFTTIVSEVADQSYVGTAVTLQLALGFLWTNVTLWLTPRLLDAFGRQAAFALQACGPSFSPLAMRRRCGTAYATQIAGSRG